MFAQDESRFSSESNHITSWSIKGTSVSYAGYKYGTSLNYFGSINLQDGTLIGSFHDRGNSSATIEHLQKVRNNYDINIPLAFLIDNASWHKTKVVKDFCSKNNITLLFLPPYSPEFNPIELVWSFFKSKVRQKFFNTAKKFKDFIIDLFKNINKTNKHKLMSLCSSLI